MSNILLSGLLKSSILLVCGVSSLFPQVHIPKERSEIKARDIMTMTRAGNSIVLGGRNKSSGILVKVTGDHVRTKVLPFVPSVDELFFVDESTGWLIAYGTGVFQTLDGAETWQAYTAAKDAQRPVFFLTKDMGWYFTTDSYLTSVRGGTGIEKLRRFPTFPSVKRVQFVNQTDGWLLLRDDYKSLFQRSKDGGHSWIDVLADTRVDQFQFVDANHGYAVTDSGIISTNDGGTSWKLVNPPLNSQLGFDRISFISPTAGWILGRDLCSTSDAGANWRCMTVDEIKKAGHVRDLLFVSKNEGWILGENGVFRSRDGGSSWSHFPISWDQVE